METRKQIRIAAILGIIVLVFLVLSPRAQPAPISTETVLYHLPGTWQQISEVVDGRGNYNFPPTMGIVEEPKNELRLYSYDKKLDSFYHWYVAEKDGKQFLRIVNWTRDENPKATVPYGFTDFEIQKITNDQMILSGTMDRKDALFGGGTQYVTYQKIGTHEQEKSKVLAMNQADTDAYCSTMIEPQGMDKLQSDPDGSLILPFTCSVTLEKIGIVKLDFDFDTFTITPENGTSTVIKPSYEYSTYTMQRYDKGKMFSTNYDLVTFVDESMDGYHDLRVLTESGKNLIYSYFYYIPSQNKFSDKANHAKTYRYEDLESEYDL